MPISLTVKSELRGLERGLTKWQRKLIPKIATTALNKAAKKIQTHIARDLSKHMGLAVGPVKKQIKIKKADKNTLTATVIARGRRFNLIRFKARETKGALVAKPWNKIQKFRTGFIGNKGRTVFIRESRNRKDIRGLFGPGLASEFVKKRVKKLMAGIGGVEFTKESIRQMKRRFARG